MITSSCNPGLEEFNFSMLSRFSVVAAALIAVGTPVSLSGARAAEPPAKKLFGAKKNAAALGARSIGSYARGCLAGGQMLPISGPGWEAMKLQRNRNWGHPRLISFLTRFATEAQQKDGWPGLLIGDLSQPRGGPMLTGHKSHQIGLDADIWFRPKPNKPLSSKERSDSWSIPLAGQYGRSVTKNWKPGYVKLIKRAASYPDTARIFLHPAVKKALCESAGDDRAWLRKVRPWWGHNFHFHVRLKCPVGYAGCVDQKPPPEGDGCGAQLDDWMKKLEAAEKWSKKPKKPKKPGKKKPRKELRLADLPQDCRGVLKANPAKSSRVVPAVAPAPERKTAVPAPAQPSTRAVSTDPNLPWLKGITGTRGGASIPDRKPR